LTDDINVIVLNDVVLNDVVLNDVVLNDVVLKIRFIKKDQSKDAASLITSEAMNKSH